MGRVLHLEDDRNLGVLLEDEYEGRGIPAEVVDSVKEAYGRLMEEQYDVVVADVNVQPYEGPEGRVTAAHILKLAEQQNPLTHKIIFSGIKPEDQLTGVEVIEKSSENIEQLMDRVKELEGKKAEEEKTGPMQRMMRLRDFARPILHVEMGTGIKETLQLVEDHETDVEYMSKLRQGWRPPTPKKMEERMEEYARPGPEKLDPGALTAMDDRLRRNLQAHKEWRRKREKN